MTGPTSWRRATLAPGRRRLQRRAGFRVSVSNTQVELGTDHLRSQALLLSWPVTALCSVPVLWRRNATSNDLNQTFRCTSTSACSSEEYSHADVADRRVVTVLFVTTST